MDFKELIKSLSKINQELREQSISAVNISLTLRNWFFGFYILEFEQNGHDRAEYGKALLASISKEIKGLQIPNTDERELRRYRQFYIPYPGVAKFISSDSQIRSLLPPGFSGIPIEISTNQIRGMPSPESMNTHIELSTNQIRGMPSPELEIPDIHYVTLFKRVSYSHFVDFIKIDDPLKKLFYELECIKGTWSVKELRRQISSLLYERPGYQETRKNY